MLTNSVYYPFTATPTPQTILPFNQRRRMIRYQSFGPPDFNDGITVWIDDTGNNATVGSGIQLVSGVILDSLPWPYCPTGAISVVTAGGTHQGLIQEFVL